MDQRLANFEWTIPFEKKPDGGVTVATPSLTNVLLMDIRAELRNLNRILNCQNFLMMPKVLRDIRRNTTKRPRKKK